MYFYHEQRECLKFRFFGGKIIETKFNRDGSPKMTADQLKTKVLLETMVKTLRTKTMTPIPDLWKILVANYEGEPPRHLTVSCLQAHLDGVKRNLFGNETFRHTIDCIARTGVESWLK